MTIWNVGSINIDHVYSVPHIPKPGETLAAHALDTGLGGKGANMAVACARAGARCALIAAIGTEGAWTVQRLAQYGVETDHIATTDHPTGHAIITRAQDGENAITLFPGANMALSRDQVETALKDAAPGDWLLLQNETALQSESAEMARARGMKIAYAAAPFEADATRAMLPLSDLLILNAVEAAQLEQALNRRIETLGLADIIVTLGAKGARHIAHGVAHDIAAIPVTPRDSTGAGDTFTGYLLALLDQGSAMPEALRMATAAAALMVTRYGTADVIPTRAETTAFLADHSCANTA